MTASRLEQAPQLGLFEGHAPGGFSQGRRHDLDAYSWVEHFCGWLREPRPLFAVLSAGVEWEQRTRWMFTQVVTEPRLTSELDSIARAGLSGLLTVAGDISKHYGVAYDSVWMNLYRDHDDSTGWHADRPVDRLPTAIVPVLSLGATRRFLMRRRAGGKSITFTVDSGDLVVMGGRCQRDWVHMVPKETRRTGARISVNFGSSEQLRPLSMDR